MPRGGRYRFVRTALWVDEDYQALSRDAKLLLLALSTGTGGNLAGIGILHREALMREAGFTAPELEATLAELEKKPTPKTSFIVRDDLNVVWVRRLLRDDPSREHDPNVLNPNHRTAVETILGALPRNSLTVKKFRSFYKFALHTPHRAPSSTPSHTPMRSPEKEIGERRTENRDLPADGSRFLDSSNGNPASRETARTRPTRGLYAEMLTAIKAQHPELTKAEAEERALKHFDEAMRRP